MNNVTCVIPVAPVPTHPSGEVLDETIASIRERLPDSEIILMFDGVPAQLMHLKSDYQEYTRRTLWKITHELKNVTPVVYTEHHHQSLMLKDTLRLVKTPLILWSEQDTPLTGEIPFDKISEVVLTGYANSVRFHHEAAIHPEHQYLMLDEHPTEVLGVPLLRTKQWSGRPHLASTDFYRKIANKYFDGVPRFIEHIMYGPVVQGRYDKFRLHLYAPEGTYVRSLHTDGRRKGATSYDPTPS